jgi:hypothetical protein
MKKTLLCLAAATLFLGCNLLKTQTGGPSPATPPAPEYDLSVKPERTEITLEWGKPEEISIQISWNTGQKYPVQLSPSADTPKWLIVESKPAILQPPGEVKLVMTAILGEAELGTASIVLGASAYGLATPRRIEFTCHVQRQTGKFVPVLAAPVTLECRGICGKVKAGRVTFYDVLREKNQSCNEKADLPEAQRIGAGGFSLSSSGFGFGRTCDVAAVY